MPLHRVIAVATAVKDKGDAAVAGTERVNVCIANQQTVAGLNVQRVNGGEQGQRVRLWMCSGIAARHNRKI